MKPPLLFLQVLHTWNNEKSDFKVNDLVQEMLTWPKQGYLDRNIWHSNLFSPGLLPQNPSTSSETEQQTHVSPMTPKISEQESEAFEKEQLDPVIWVPKLCQHFKIEELKLLKEVGRDRINEFLDGIANTTIQHALKSLLWELKCIYVPPIEMDNLTDLPDIIDKRRRYLTLNRDEDDEAKFKELIEQLECTMWKCHRSSIPSYEFLMCLATLSLFNFNLDELRFNDNLKEKDVERLSTELRENFSEMKTLKTSKNKQAFLLNIALNNHLQKKKVVDYIQMKLQDKLCSSFSDSTVGTCDLRELEKVVNSVLSRTGDDKILREKQKSLSMYFNSIFSHRFSENHTKEENLEVKEEVRVLLKDLGLVKYYPQKISYNDVIKLTEKDALKRVHEKPSTLPELPWYFVRKLIGLDGSIRETGSVPGEISEIKSEFGEVESNEADEEGDLSWDDDWQESFESVVCDNITDSIHPLDLIYIIFLCADDFLRQELADKMFRCQYAVPFILSSYHQPHRTGMSHRIQSFIGHCREYPEHIALKRVQL